MLSCRLIFVGQISVAAFTIIIIKSRSNIIEKDKQKICSRNYCKRMPNILPRLLDAVKWQSRDEVSQLYLLCQF
jgi:hypothetical protein